MHYNNNRANSYNKNKNRYSRPRREDRSSSEQEHYETNCSKRKKQGNGYRMREEVSISSSASDSGVIKFDNTVEKIANQKDITPWMSNGTKNIKDSLLRFHNQIIEFFNYIKPSKKSHSQKLKKFNFIKDKIVEFFPKAEVIAFGSFATQLYLPDGDVDIAVLTNNQYPQSQVYNKIDRYLESKSNAATFLNVEYIRKSKVPLIKFEYEDTHFDISVDKADGISQVKYVQKINELFPEFKYLTLVFKCTLRIRGLADTYTGGIGSFLLSCMILVYLKITVEKKNYFNLAEHVIEFMKFYAMNEDFWRNKVIYVKEGRILDRQNDGLYFSCISPQDETHDIGKSAFKIKEVFNVLRNRCRYILDKNFGPGESILRVLVNPSDQIFRYFKESKND